jgi:TetR/AcrR family transcriptional regulator, acrAB operon repressor
VVRRTKTEAAATRDSLLDAALRVFRERGVAHTSLEEVAAAAGVTRGAVYWHFKDKADLFTALTERVQLPMEAMLAAAGEKRQDDPLDTLRTLAIDCLVRLASDARTQAVFDVIFHKCEFAAGMTSVAERQHTACDGCLENVERLLKQAVVRRQLPRDTDTRLAARCMNAFMVGVMHEWVQRPDSYDLKRAAPRMVDMFIAGLREEPPRRAVAAAGDAAGRPRPRAGVRRPRAHAADAD